MDYDTVDYDTVDYDTVDYDAVNYDTQSDYLPPNQHTCEMLRPFRDIFDSPEGPNFHVLTV